MSDHEPSSKASPIPLISVIIPTQNNERTIRACLQTIRTQTYPEVEVIVVDNSSSDLTATTASELADTVLMGGPERSAQRNLGAAVAKGEYLLFLDSDMTLSPSVADEVVQTFANAPSLVALILPEAIAGGGNFWARCRAIEKRAYLGDQRAEAARAFRTAWFRQSLGFDEGLTGPEDWELTDRVILNTRGGLGRIHSITYHDEGDLDLRTAFRKKRYYARSWGKYVAKTNWVGHSHVIRFSLAKPLLALPVDPLHVLGLYILKVAELLGFITGLLDARRSPKVINSLS